MRKSALLFTLVFCFTLPAVELSDRADQQAKQAFLDLNFFSEGRGMIMSPGLIDMYEFFVPGLGLVSRKSMEEKWGLVFNDEGEVSGLHSESYRNFNVGTVGCAVCHSGRAAGVFVPGLGNKTVDVQKMASDLHRIESWWDGLKPDILQNKSYLEVEDNAMAFARYLSDERLGNLTQGLVPVAFIRGWFYRIQGLSIPEMTKGQVKVPHLWGYGAKRRVGQFCDGLGDGDKVGWGVAVELAAGQTPSAVRNYYHEVEEAELAMEYFLPPKYPFEIIPEKAEAGKAIFDETCAKCHGTYETDGSGFPVYRAPNWIPWGVVKTDYDRLKSNREEFTQLVETSPLSDIIRIKRNEDGYFAPRLEGIWARFPYLHNASVPTLWDLMQPVVSRPRHFDLKNAGSSKRYDDTHLGLLVDRSDQAQERLRRRARRGVRSVYSQSRIGHSAQGHEFYVHELSDAEKFEIIEYLKTL